MIHYLTFDCTCWLAPWEAKGQLFAGNCDDEAQRSTLLISNDRSKSRRARLRRVFDDFLPAALLREPAQVPRSVWLGDASSAMMPVRAVAVTGVDAALWGRTNFAGGFDRILVDAPCSSERHFFLDKAAGQVWTRARLKRDAELQSSILRNAVRLLAEGGRLVYATCSLAQEENDGVISKLLKHRRHGAGLVLGDALGVELQDASIARLLTGVERTSMGARMLPDRSRFGPLYWSVLERLSPRSGESARDEPSVDPNSNPDPP